MNIINSNLLSSIIEKFVMWIYSSYDTILIGSKSFEPIIKKRFKNRINYFPNWADDQIENNMSLSKNHLNFFTKDKTVIMYTGNIGFAQGFSDLIPIIRELESLAYWIFIGDGRYKKTFSSLINEKELDNCVEFESEL